MGNLFQELKRRKVFRVAVAYAVVGWVLAQVAAFAVETFAAPQWVQQIFVVFLVLGFPLAILLAWAYEITPAGIGADRGVQSGQPANQSTDQRVNYAILGLVVLVAGFQIADRFVLVSDESQGNSLPPSVTSVVRTNINLGLIVPEDSLHTRIAISPDGLRLAYTDFQDGKRQLYIREFGELQPRFIGEIPGSGGGANMFFSPDGEWVAFHSPDGLMKISIQGGVPQLLVNLGGSGGTYAQFGGDWTQDETILFADNSGELSSVPVEGGSAEKLGFETVIEGGYDVWPSLLPDGKSILITPTLESEVIEGKGTYLIDRVTGISKLLIENGHIARYASSGHIVFMRSATIWAVPFDLDRLEITGAEVPIQSGITTNSRFGVNVFGFSDNGSLVYLPGTDMLDPERGLIPASANKTNLVWVNKEGLEEPLPLLAPQYQEDPALSPDGQQLALIPWQVDGSSNIRILEFSSGAFSPVTFLGDAHNLLWTPDGQRLLFERYSSVEVNSTNGSIWVVNANGTGEEEQLINLGLRMVPRAFSPDGAWLIYEQAETTGLPLDLYMLDMADIAGTPRALLTSEYSEEQPSISPNGQWMAYTSDESGLRQVYVRPFPNVDDDKVQVSLNGGQEPRWSDDGRNLYYLSPADKGLISAVVNIESGFNVGERELIYSDPNYNIDTRNWPTYAVDSTNQRFLIMKAVSEAGSTETLFENTEREPVFTSLVLVENWFEELKRLAPPDPQ